MVKNLNVRLEILKVLWESIGKTLENTGIDNPF
jgi:hypothetical protein